LFLNALRNALAPEGILISQIGKGVTMDDIPESLDDDNHVPEFIRGLGRAGFEDVLRYDESQGRLAAPWSFLFAMKHYFHRSTWYANEAEWNLRIQTRAMRTHEGVLPFRFLDSATMMSYQFPSRAVQEIWCMDKPDLCRGNRPAPFDPEISDIPISSFSVKASTVASAGRGVFANDFIPKGSYLGAEDCVSGLVVPPYALQTIEGMSEKVEALKQLAVYLDAYGWVEDFYVRSL
jgi:hypothetical protein